MQRNIQRTFKAIQRNPTSAGEVGFRFVRAGFAKRCVQASFVKSGQQVANGVPFLLEFSDSLIDL